jgi:hypothetical protein
VLFFRRPILSTYEGTTRWLLKLLILAWPIPTQLFYPCSHSLLYFFFLLKPEGFDSVSSLGFRDSFSAKLSRIWQIASRDSVTIFLFHETCKRVFFPSDLPYCLVRTLKSRKSFPIPSPKGLNEREKINLETMAKDFNNRLITPELEKAMQDYPLYSQDSKKKDAVCIAVFFIGNARWYILEGQRENDDFVLFGIVVGLAETEYSYISANEMASVELDATKFGLGKVRVEQRKPFQPCQLSEIIDRELQSFLSRLYD